MKKKNIIIIVLLILLFPVTGFAKTYTRKELQDYVVSTALSYYWNKSNTEYEGYWRDEPHSTYTVDYKVSPEMISRSNYMNTMCVGFAATVYKYSLGYDFTDFSNDLGLNNRYNYFKDINGNIIEPKYSSSNMNIAIEEFNKIYSVGYWNKIARNHYAKSNSPSPIVVLTYQQNKLSTIPGITNTSKNITDMSTSEQNTIINYLKENLQPGDIILNDGHGMIWVGDALEDTGGIIHSSGLSYVNGTESSVSTGYDDFSVRYSNLDYLIEKQVKHHGSKSNSVITILRPINAFCGDSNTCNVDIDSNTVARNSFKNLKVEQFIYNDADYNVMSIDTSSIGNGYKFSYRLYLKNESNSNYCTSNSYKKEDTCTSNGYEWRTTSNHENYNGLTITAKVPDNTKFVSCSNNCNVNGKTITWNNVNILAGDAESKYYYVVKPTKNNVTIVNDGMELSNGKQTLKLGKIETKVNNTINGSYKKQLKNIIAEEKVNYKTSKDFVASIYTKFYTANTSVNNDTFTNLLDANKIGNTIFKKHTYDEYYEIQKPGATDEISSMVVQHFFGGKKYEQVYHPNEMNYYGNRVIPIWSTAIQFNYGDIIVTLNENNGSFTFKNMFIYTGYDNSVPTYTYLDNGTIVQHRIINNYHNTNTNWYANKFLLYELHNSDLYVVLRPSQYFKPVLIPATVEEPVIEEPTIEEPIIEEPTPTIDTSKDPLPIPEKEGYDFKGWYYKTGDDEEEEGPITSTSELPDISINLYPKWKKISNYKKNDNNTIIIIGAVGAIVLITTSIIVIKRNKKVNV